MALLEFHTFKCRSDNYGVLVHDSDTDITISIDAPQEAAILEALTEKGWTLTHILNIHHHLDHVEANAALKAKFNCKIIGPKSEADKIPEVDEVVAGCDRFKIGNYDVEVIDCPGHTLGQVSYYIPEANVAFTGDTLFAMGCGRIFEGTAEQMLRSLERLRKLPEKTQIYFGHEYTVANGKFALSVDPFNDALKERVAKIEEQLEAGEFTVPTTLREELLTNPFLRSSDRLLRQNLMLENATDLEVFTQIRRRKDNA